MMERRLFRVFIQWAFEGSRQDREVYVAVRADTPPRMAEAGCREALDRVVTRSVPAEISRLEFLGPVFVEPERLKP